MYNLKNEIEENRRMRPILVNGGDAEFYNECLISLGKTGHDTYFTAALVLAECYVYRRIREAFEMT